MLPSESWGIGEVNVTRSNRLAVLGAATLIVAATGTVLATRAPRSDGQPAPPAASQAAEEDTEGPPTAETLAHAQERLEAGGITVDAAELSDLAGRYGLGGAVRVLAWAEESGTSPADITAMRDGDGSPESVMGWGQIAKELGVHPGIGSIMGNGGGHGHDDAPGQQDDEAP
jgi:hypothetical protein